MTARTFPPRWKHREFNEDLYEWSHRYNPGYWGKHYTCKFCPGRGDAPDEVDHSPACPCFVDGTDTGGVCK